MSGWSVKGDIVQSINAWISVTFSLTGITFVHCSYLSALSLLDSTKFEQTRPSTRSTATQSVEMLHL